MSDDDVDDEAAHLPEDDSIFDLSTRSNMSDAFEQLVEDLEFQPNVEQSTPARQRRGQVSSPAQPSTSGSQPASSACTTPPRRSSRRTSSPTPYQSPTALRHRGAGVRSGSPTVRPSRVTAVSGPALPLSGLGDVSTRGITSQVPAAAPAAQSVPVPPPTTKVKCPKCPQVLANKKTLDRHLRTHLMKGVMSKAPTSQDYAGAMKELFCNSLEEILKEPIIGQLCADVHTLAKSLKGKSEDLDMDEGIAYLAQCFSDIIDGKKVIFPSSILHLFHVNVNRLLSNQEFRQEFKCHFGSLVDCSDSVLNVFIGDIILKLSDAVIVYTMQKIRNVTTASTSKYKRRSKDDINSLDFRQLSYYIGGSVVSGFLWKGDQYSKTSNVWSAYCQVLREQFLRSDDTGEKACDESVRAHTDSADRGGLTHISNDAFSFFTSLFHFLMGLEGEDGSLPPDVIDNYVLSNDIILCLWDVLRGNFLNEDQCLDLLVQICESCAKTVTKGIMKRRMNEHIQKAFNSVALRARLAA